MDSIIKKSRINMPNFCFTCLKEIPTPAADQTQHDTHHSVKFDKNIINILHINTGIVYNVKDNYPKQLCKKCYMKIMDFEEFRDTALCCATALHQLLLEEHFPTTTLNNLKYFCCLCLTKMQTLSKTSNQLNNIEVIRWMEECNQLRDCSAVEQWPSSVCDSCCVKLNDFIVFENLAKESLKKLENELEKAENNDSEAKLNTEKREATKSGFEIELRSKQTMNNTNNPEEECHYNTELLEKTDNKNNIQSDKEINELRKLNVEHADTTDKQAFMKFEFHEKVEEVYTHHCKTKKTKRGKKRGKKIKIRTAKDVDLLNTISKKVSNNEDAPLTTCSRGVVEQTAPSLKSQVDCEESLLYLNNLKISEDSEIRDNNIDDNTSIGEFIQNPSPIIPTPVVEADIECENCDENNKQSSKDNISIATSSLDSSKAEESDILFVAPRAKRLKRKAGDIKTLEISIDPTNLTNNESKTTKHEKSMQQIPEKSNVLVDTTTYNESMHAEDVENSNDIVIFENTGDNEKRSTKCCSELPILKGDVVQSAESNNIEVPKYGTQISENSVSNEKRSAKNPRASKKKTKVTKLKSNPSVEYAEDKGNSNDTEMSENGLDNYTRSTKNISITSYKPTNSDVIAKCLPDPNTILVDHVDQRTDNNAQIPKYDTDRRIESKVQTAISDVQISKSYIPKEKRSTRNISKASKKITKTNKLPKPEILFETPTNNESMHAEDVGNINDAEISENALGNETSATADISITSNDPTSADVIAKCLPDPDINLVDDDVEQITKSNVQVRTDDIKISDISVSIETRSAKNIAKTSRKKTKIIKRKSVLSDETPTNNDSILAEDKGNSNEKEMSENTLDIDTSTTKQISITSNDPKSSDVIAKFSPDIDSSLVDDVDQRTRSNVQIPTDDAEILDNSIPNEKRSTRNISKASKKIYEIFFESSTNNEFMHAEDDVGNGNKAEISENTLDDETSCMENISMISNEPTSSDVIDQRTESNNVQVPTDDIKDSEIYVSIEKRSAKNITKASRKKTKIIKRKTNLSDETPTNNDTILPEDKGNSNETEMPENGLDNETSTTKNISVTSNEPTSSEVIAKCLPDIDSSLVDDIDQRTQSNVQIPKENAQISDNSIPNEKRSTRNNSKASKKIYETIFETSTNNESMHAEDVGNSNKAENSENAVDNETSCMENISIASNDPTSSDVIAKSLPDPDTSLVDDVEEIIKSNIQIPKNDAQIYVNTVSNKKRSTKNILKAEKKKMKVTKQPNSEILVENPTATDSTLIEDVSQKTINSYTQNSEISALNKTSSTKKVSKVKIKKSRRSSKSHTAIEGPTDSGFTLAENAALERKYNEDGIPRNINLEIDVNNISISLPNNPENIGITSKSQTLIDSTLLDDQDNERKTISAEFSGNATHASSANYISMTSNGEFVDTSTALDCTHKGDVDLKNKNNDSGMLDECLEEEKLTTKNNDDTSFVNTVSDQTIMEINISNTVNEQSTSNNIEKSPAGDIGQVAQNNQTDISENSVTDEPTSTQSNTNEKSEPYKPDNSNTIDENISITSNDPTSSDVIAKCLPDPDTSLVDDVEEIIKSNIQIPKNDAQIYVNTVSNKKRSTKNILKAEKKKMKVTKQPNSEILVENATTTDYTLIEDVSQKTINSYTQNSEISALNKTSSTKKNSKVKIKKSRRSSKSHTAIEGPTDSGFTLAENAALERKYKEDGIPRNINLEIDINNISISLPNNPENIGITSKSQTLIDSTLLDDQDNERKTISAEISGNATHASSANYISMTSNGEFGDISIALDCTHKGDVDLKKKNNNSGMLAESREEEKLTTINNDDTRFVNTVSDQPIMEINISNTVNEQSTLNNIADFEIEKSPAGDIGQVAQNNQTEISENSVTDESTSAQSNIIEKSEPNKPDKSNTIDETSTTIDSNYVQDESSQKKDNNVAEISENSLSFGNNESHTTKDDLKSHEAAESSKVEGSFESIGLGKKNSDALISEKSDNIESTFIPEENVEPNPNVCNTKLPDNFVLNQPSAIKDISKMTKHETTSTKSANLGLIGKSATVIASESKNNDPNKADVGKTSITKRISKASNTKSKSNKPKPSKSNTFSAIDTAHIEGVDHKSRDCDSHPKGPSSTKKTSKVSLNECLIDKECATKNLSKIPSTELKSNKQPKYDSTLKDESHKSRDLHVKIFENSYKTQPSSSGSISKATNDYLYSTESDREAASSSSLGKNSTATISTDKRDVERQVKNSNNKFFEKHPSSSKNISNSLYDKWTSREPVESDVFGEYPMYSRHALERGHKRPHSHIQSTESSSMYSPTSSTRHMSMATYKKYGSRESHIAYDSKYRNERPVSPVSRYKTPNMHNSMQRHIYEANEMSPNSYKRYSMQHGYQCRGCMKVFKHRGQLNKHMHYSPRCARM